MNGWRGGGARPSYVRRRVYLAQETTSALLNVYKERMRRDGLFALHHVSY